MTIETRYRLIKCQEPECKNTFRWNGYGIKPKRCMTCENLRHFEKQKQYAQNAIQKKKAAWEENGKSRKPARTQKKHKRTLWENKPTHSLIHHVQYNIVNPYIRARDNTIFKGECISCSDEKLMEAGHRFAVGDYPGIRFLISNIHGQGTNCNQFLNGNIEEFDKGIKKRFGGKYLEILHQTAELYQHGHIKLMRSEIIEIGRTYKYLHENKLWVFSPTKFNYYLKIINGNI